MKNKTLTLFTLLAFVSIKSPAETIEVVQSGESKYIDCTQSGYEPHTEDGALVLKTPTRNPLEKFPVKVWMGPQFSLKARMALEGVQKSACALFFHGKIGSQNVQETESQFYFETMEETMRSWGLLFMNCKGVVESQRVPSVVLDGDFFDFELEVAPTGDKKSMVVMRINEETLLETTAPSGLIESISPEGAVVSRRVSPLMRMTSMDFLSPLGATSNSKSKKSPSNTTLGTLWLSITPLQYINSKPQERIVSSIVSK